MGECEQSELGLLIDNWRAIPTFPNYQISHWGQVRNKWTGKYLKITYPEGVGVVKLSYNGKIFARSVGRLLEKIFGQEKPKHVVYTYVCPRCKERLRVQCKESHSQSCKDTRDPSIEYFEH